MSAVFSEDIRIEAMTHAHVEVRPGVAATEYRITGTLPDVFEAISAVFRGWPAMGYGTIVHTITSQRDQEYIARMSRANSCD